MQDVARIVGHPDLKVTIDYLETDYVALAGEARNAEVTAIPELHGELDFLKIKYLSSDEIVSEDDPGRE